MKYKNEIQLEINDVQERTAMPIRIYFEHGAVVVNIACESVKKSLIFEFTCLYKLCLHYMEPKLNIEHTF